MYYQFFGVEKPPFNLTADPEFLYLTPQHREALAGLSYAILARKGFVVLTGTAGTGKTTLLARIMEHLPVSRIRSSVILNPTLSPSEFLEAVLIDFKVKDIPASKAQRIARLQGLLCAWNRLGQVCALIVDEAHKLSPEVLEEIRLLGNFEFGNQKLLQVALAGQRELDDLLNSDHLQQFKQRIARRMTIGPLTADDVGPYIRHRWAVAGGKEPPFSAEAAACISRGSQGIPRLINVICDNALVDAFAEGSRRVESRHIVAVCRDLQWNLPVAPPPAPTQAPASQAEAEPVPVWATDAYPMKTLERYSASAERQPSLLARLRQKFKSPRTEVA